MVWFVVCAVIVVLGGGYLFLQGREVWRKGARLVEEVDRAVRRAEDAAGPRAPEDPHRT